MFEARGEYKMKDLITAIIIIAFFVLPVYLYQEEPDPPMVGENPAYQTVKSKPVKQKTALQKAKMEWREARAAQVAAVVKYGKNRHTNPEYDKIRNRAVATMERLSLERARAEY